MPLWSVVQSDESEANDDVVLPSPQSTVSGNSTQQRGTRVEATRVPHGPVYPNSHFLVDFDEPADVNKNTAWFSYPGVWSSYVFIVLLVWLLVLATLGCDVATAWVVVNIIHFVVTFYLFHWVKGSPFAEDQGLYDKLTWWEQMDGGRQHTINRKFITMVPVVLYLLVSVCTSSAPHASPLLFLNTMIVFVLVIAKLPLLHRVRIFGING